VIKRIVLILTGVALITPGCGGGRGAAASSETVVASFYPLAYAAQLVGGRAVKVENLTPTGAEPHELELSARDTASLEEIGRAHV